MGWSDRFLYFEIPITIINKLINKIIKKKSILFYQLGISGYEISYVTRNETQIKRIQSVINGFNLIYDFNNNPLEPIDSSNNNYLNSIISQDTLIS